MTYYLSLIFIISLLGCSANISTQDSVKLDEHYPRWLKSGNYKTAQTSGIAFIEENENGSDEFFLIDDIGKLHRLKISNDTIFTFTEIKFSEEVADYLNTFPKIDFEEISYDKVTGDVYVTIEGNGPDFLKYNGIYNLEFKDNNIFCNLVTGIKKIELIPKAVFAKHVRENIGYEGLAVSKKYLYLGLEGILNKDNSFSGNALILVVDKSNLQILKEIYTEELNIASICGLYAESDSILWGIDRNNMTIFILKFNNSLKITSYRLLSLRTVVPSYNEYEYTGSLESIAMNERKNIFLVDDPWHSHFVPDSTILQKLDEVTIKNYQDFVPVIHKFTIE